MRGCDLRRLLTLTGVLVLTMSAFLTWIKATISGGTNPSISFGWTAALIGCMAGIGWFYRSSKVLAVCGVMGLGLCGFSIVHLALRDPAFWSLVDENSQYGSIMSFSRLNLPANYGIEPAFRDEPLNRNSAGSAGHSLLFYGLGMPSLSDGRTLAPHPIPHRQRAGEICGGWSSLQV